MNIQSPSKEQLITACHQWVNAKIQQLHKGLQDLQKANIADTKSSAGDKYETSREMIQREKNKLNQQLVIFENQRKVLSKIQTQMDINRSNDAFLGKLILTPKGVFFIAIVF